MIPCVRQWKHVGSSALISQRYDVRVLTIETTSDAARQLAAAGAQLFLGDLNDRASLDQAVDGALGVFSVQLPPPDDDRESEVRAVRNLVKAARAAGVHTFVQSSVARAGDEEEFEGWKEGRWWRDYWTSKTAANDVVRAAGFQSWVILKPAFMMENFIPPKVAWMFPALEKSRVESVMAAEAKLDLVAAEDIARFAVAAFEQPDRFNGQGIDIAGDSLSMGEVASSISEATGKTVTAHVLSHDEAVKSGIRSGVAESQQWASVEGYKVDFGQVRSHGIPIESFASWARRHAGEFVIDSNAR